MSLLDTVEPDLVWHIEDSGDPDEDDTFEATAVSAGECPNCVKLYRETKVESLLAEHRKQVLLEAVAVARQEAYVNQTAYVVFEKLRRMAEGEKE